MPDFEATIKQAVEDRVLPPVVLIAGDKTGKLDYRQSYGSVSLGSDDASGSGSSGSSSQHEPIGPESAMIWMSLTKLPTAVAVLQLVERGVLPGLDDPDAVAAHLPELAAQEVLVQQPLPPAEGAAAAAAPPLTRPRGAPITLRHLLTHSSGLAYPFLPGPLADLLARRRVGGGEGEQQQQEESGNRQVVQELYAYPLLFEPGQGWSYGPGLDWAGLLLERASGASLERHIRDSVWAPLGVAGDAAPAFFPAAGPAVVRTSARDAQTGKVGPGPPLPPTPQSGQQQQQQQQGACLGGEGMRGGVGALASLLASLLAGDGRVLSPASAAALFEPQLAGEARRSLLAQLEHPEWIAGYVPPNGGEYNWALGGLVVEGDSLVAGRRRGFLMWGGMYNSSWFIDREAGLYGLFATQTLPPGDAKVREMTKLFQEEMYSRLG